MIVLVTMLNYLVIVISESTIDVAKDFLAMMIISDFDNYFFEEHHSHELSKNIILNKDDKYFDLFTVMRTTSRDCYRLEEDDENYMKFNVFKPLRATKWLNQFRHRYGIGVLSCPTHMNLKPSERKCWNYTLFKFYQFLRFLYVGFWFYFSPFFFSTVQFVFPIYYLYKYRKMPEGAGEEEGLCPGGG